MRGEAEPKRAQVVVFSLEGPTRFKVGGWTILTCLAQHLQEIARSTVAVGHSGEEIEEPVFLRGVTIAMRVALWYGEQGRVHETGHIRVGSTDLQRRHGVDPRSALSGIARGRLDPGLDVLEPHTLLRDQPSLEIIQVGPEGRDRLPLDARDSVPETHFVPAPAPGEAGEAGKAGYAGSGRRSRAPAGIAGRRPRCVVERANAARPGTKGHRRALVFDPRLCDRGAGVRSESRAMVRGWARAVARDKTYIDVLDLPALLLRYLPSEPVQVRHLGNPYSGKKGLTTAG